MIDKYLLISKYLSGEISAVESDLLEDWRKLSDANERDFQELRESWTLAHLDTTLVVPNKEKVWKHIVSHIEVLKPSRMYSHLFLYRSIGITAAIALIIGLSLPFAFNEIEPEKQVCIKAPAGQKTEITLPDGTQAMLNSGSTLTYSTSFSRTNRSVMVEGQAFFDVKKDIKHPFNVSIGPVNVVVHGTSFDVNGYVKDSLIEVSLLSGKVNLFSSITGELLTEMKPNQKAKISRYTKEKHLLEYCNANEQSLWRFGKLKIANEQLTDIIRKMERWYGVNIELKDKPTSKLYWMTIKTESLKEMLEIINRMTPIHYTINGEEVIIICK